MPTQTKPWKPFWKLLEAVLDDLVESAPQSPIKGRVSDWISEVRFGDTYWVEFALRQWSTSNDLKADFRRFLLPDNPNVHWEAILRFSFAMDFVRGRWGERKKFDFARPHREVLDDLLSDEWRGNVFHWCARCLYEVDDDPKRLLPTPPEQRGLN